MIEIWHCSEFPHVELRRGFGVARPVPRHWHDEYQLCLVQSGSGELTYRGERHATPSSTLFVVHPGEVHSNRAHDSRGCSYRDLFIHPELVRRTSTELRGKDSGLPFFSTVVISEREVIARYLELHFSFEHSSSKLEREARLLNLLASLIERFAEEGRVAPASSAERRAVTRACDYLIEHHAENVSLETLAGMASLSPFHFNRLFSAQFGVPPHQFQTLLRIARVKALLREGWSIPQAAMQAGFFDQSHLNRHFKRVVGVTPGQYCASSKNVQDRSAALS